MRAKSQKNITCNTVIENNICFIRIGDLLKTSWPNFHVGQLDYPAFSEDKSICKVTFLEQYINKTRNHRGAYTKLFLSYIKPFTPVSMDTLSRWIKKTLRDSGIDMNIFSRHSTRSASTTLAKQFVPLETVLKTGGWRSMKTFAIMLSILKTLSLFSCSRGPHGPDLPSPWRRKFHISLHVMKTFALYYNKPVITDEDNFAINILMS